MGNNQWMYSFRYPRLGPIDARIFFVILITVMHFTKFTVFLSVVMMILLLYIERWKRISLPSALRLVACEMTSFIFTKTRYARNVDKRISYIDYEDLFNK